MKLNKEDWDKLDIALPSDLLTLFMAILKDHYEQLEEFLHKSENYNWYELRLAHKSFMEGSTNG